MACNKPLQAYQCFDGSVVFQERKGDVVRSLQLPCGKCWGCRLERSRQWAIRCMHEASLYERNCFITLTYNDAHLPPGKSLQYSDFQKFMKRFRKRFPNTKIRFYMAGEYGEKYGRPHFHACVFNFDFSDRQYLKTTGSGSKLYTSKVLESLWCDDKGQSIGYSSVGDVNFQSAAYVARYIMKKRTGKGIDPETGLLYTDVYDSVDEDTGEIIKRVPEFNKMSLKPGIGANWLDKYKSDVYPHDYVIVNGVRVKPPKFYDRKFSKENPYEFEEVSYVRESRARDRYEDNVPERLVVKEQVLSARLSLLPRTID